MFVGGMARRFISRCVYMYVCAPGPWRVYSGVSGNPVVRIVVGWRVYSGVSGNPVVLIVVDMAACLFEGKRAPFSAHCD